MPHNSLFLPLFYNIRTYKLGHLSFPLLSFKKVDRKNNLSTKLYCVFSFHFSFPSAIINRGNNPLHSNVYYHHRYYRRHHHDHHHRQHHLVDDWSAVVKWKGMLFNTLTKSLPVLHLLLVLYLKAELYYYTERDKACCWILPVMMTTIRLSMCIIALPLDAHSSVHQPWPHISVVFQQNTCPRIMSNYTRLLHRHQIHYFPYLLLLSNAVVVPERSLIFQKVKWHCHQNTLHKFYACADNI